MAKLGDASAVYAGAAPAKAVYLGGAQVWPLGPKIVWSQDFESGSIAGIFNQVGGSPSPTVSADAAHAGGYGLKTVGDPSWARRNFPSVGLTVVRCWVMFPVVPGFAVEFMTLAYGGIRFGINKPANTIGALHGTAQVFPIDSGVVVTPGRWYLLDARADCRAQPRVLDWQIDGVDQPQGLGDYAPAMDCSTYWGHSTSYGGSNDVRFDDVAVSQTFDDYPLGDVPVTRAAGPDPLAGRILPPVTGPA